MFYKKGIDITNDKQMFNFLKDHYTYSTMNSWNGLHSIANNVKIYKLNLSGDCYNALALLQADDYFTINMMIEDWELGMLYWNCLKSRNGNEEEACQLVRKKYFEEMVNGKEFYFFVGTTKSFHMIAPNPFIIIGTFWPKKEVKQYSLFD